MEDLAVFFRHLYAYVHLFCSYFSDCYLHFFKFRARLRLKIVLYRQLVVLLEGYFDWLAQSILGFSIFVTLVVTNDGGLIYPDWISILFAVLVILLLTRGG